MPGLRNNLLISRILYVLEKQYSKRITVVKVQGVVNDVSEGTSERQSTEYVIKAIVLPDTNVRKHLYNAAYLSMSRNFTYGALYDEVATPIIIRKKRLPNGLSLTTNDRCIIDGQGYSFKSVSTTADDRGVHILAKASPGEL